MNRRLAGVLAFCVAVRLAAQSPATENTILSGIVLSEGSPVQDVYVTFEETGEFAVTGSSGVFSLPVPAEAPRTLVATADGYLPFIRELPESVPERLEIRLEKEVVEMEPIEVTAEREPTPRSGRVTATMEREEIRSSPTAGDPFSVIDFESGIVFQEMFTDGNYTETSLSLGLDRSARTYSVFGADSDFNSCYYDYILIPANRHASGNPLIPIEAVDHMEIWKGVAPVEYGPGIGGLFRAVPDTSFTTDSLLVSPGTDSSSVVWKKKLSPRSGFLFSATKSFSELTTTPMLWSIKLLYEVMGIPLFDGTPVIIPSWGDLLLRYFTTADSGSLSLDLLSYYDATFMRLDMLGDYDARSDMFPVFAALGANWTTVPAPSLLNTLSAHATYYHETGSVDQDMDLESYSRALAEQMDLDPDELQADMEKIANGYVRIYENTTMEIFAVNGKEELTFIPFENLSLSAGLTGRYAVMEAAYSGNADMDMEFYGLRLKEKYDIPRTEYGETLVRFHGYLTSSLTHGPAELRLGAGGTWYPLHSAWNPGLEAELAWTGDTQVSVRAGWSEGSFEELAYLHRKLNEKIAGTESATSFSRLPRSVSLSSRILPKASGTIQAVLEPWTAWYYDLSGLALQASWLDPYADDGDGNTVNQLRMLDPDLGFSMGLGAGLLGTYGKINLTLRYIPSLTLYHSREGGENAWFYPNNDVRHTLKAVCTGPLGAHSELSGSLTMYVDRPFTPERVTDASTGTLEKERFNSARDLVPRFTLGVKWEKPSTFFKKPGRYTIDCRNILAFFNPELIGMKPESRNVAGASTSRFGHRKYSFLRTDILQVLLSMEISMGGSYSF